MTDDDRAALAMGHTRCDGCDPPGELWVGQHWHFPDGTKATFPLDTDQLKAHILSRGWDWCAETIRRGDGRAIHAASVTVATKPLGTWCGDTEHEALVAAFLLAVEEPL